MVHVHTATVQWERGGQDFLDRRYSRGHLWRFDGGAEVRASSAPSVVPVPLSDEAGVDPEEAFVASLSSCHMLFFLDFASRAGIVVDRYEDAAEGVMGKTEAGRTFVARVTLRPALLLSGAKRPEAGELAALHHKAHEYCFIANSVLSEVVVEPASVRFA
jgi:organic hydroperoxide reductase OsmC/OhrA